MSFLRRQESPQQYENSNSRYRIRRIEHSDASGTEKQRRSSGCGSREGGEDQPPGVAHPGRIYREVLCREEPRPGGHARRSVGLPRRRFRGDIHPHQLRPPAELLRHLPRGGGRRTGPECQSRGGDGYQIDRACGLYPLPRKAFPRGTFPLLARIPPREQGAVRQPVSVSDHSRLQRDACLSVRHAHI